MNKAEPPRSVDAKESELSEQQFAELKIHLEKLVHIRNDEAQATNAHVAEVLRQQERTREEERLRSRPNGRSAPSSPTACGSCAVPNAGQMGSP